MTRDTLRTVTGLAAAELRRLKLAHKASVDLRERKRLVARIEALRVAYAELETLCMAARAKDLGIDAESPLDVSEEGTT